MFRSLSHVDCPKVQKSSEPAQETLVVFRARLIEPSNLRAAFAVMQLAVPGANLNEFRKMVAGGRLLSPGGALVGLFDRRHYAHAVFKARTEQLFDQQLRLKVSELTHGDSISTVIMLEMIDAIEEWAREMGCDNIAIEAGRGDKSHGLPLSDMLVARGFSGEMLVMARRI